MSVYTKLVSTVIFPVHERLKGHSSVARLRGLESSQWWPAERLEKWRSARLREFLVDIGTHVPYYREAFRRMRLEPHRLTSVAELSQYPMLSKDLIRTHTEAMRSERAGPLKRYNTGGSSGEPLVFFIGKDRISHDVAAKWRATRWWGVDIGDPEIVVWGSPVELGAQDRVRAMRDLVFRTELVPAFGMSKENLAVFLERIRRRRPAMLFGYPSSLALLADYSASVGQPMADLGIRVAFVTSERLYDHQRRAIESAFGCPVANGYGGRDAGFIAHECPAGSMHISAEDIVVEIMGPDGALAPPGEEGEILVTHLATGEFPFVRYRTGDVGALGAGPCSCGRGLPVLQSLQGRSTDFVVAQDGTLMHGLALIYVIRDLPSIARFKIIQESRAHTRVLIVPEARFDAGVEQAIRRGVQERLGTGVEVTIERVAAIPAERSGKHRYVVSRVTA